MRQPLTKFFADRGPHLAAMIAYFALLSLVPLVFLSLALLGLFGRADESTYLVRELKTVLPSASIARGRDSTSLLDSASIAASATDWPRCSSGYFGKKF